MGGDRRIAPPIDGGIALDRLQQLRTRRQGLRMTVRGGRLGARAGLDDHAGVPGTKGRLRETKRGAL